MDVALVILMAPLASSLMPFHLAMVLVVMCTLMRMKIGPQAQLVGKKKKVSEVLCTWVNSFLILRK